jgi:PAS domain S-box-containing protein
VLDTQALPAYQWPDEAEPHLRAVIEREPVALARVGRDGTLLAVNEAGLSMFGADSLEQILGTSLSQLAIPEQRQPFQDFLTVVAEGDRGSFEADLVGLTGRPHQLDIRASRHPGAPDGIASSLLAFHDVSSLRRLEQALEDASRLFQHEGVPSSEQLKELRDRFEAVQAERRDLLASSALLRVEAKFHRHTADDRSSRLEALELSRAQAVDTAKELQATLDEREAHVAELAGRVEQLESAAAQQVDVTQIEAAHLSRLVELEAAHVAQVRDLETTYAARARALESDHAARVTTVEKKLTEERQAHERRIHEFEQAAAGGAGSSAEVAILTVRTAELEAAHATKVSELAVAHAARLATMQRSLADLQRAHEHRVSELEQSAAARFAEAESTHATHLADVEGAHAEQRAAFETTLTESQTALHESHIALQGSQTALAAAVARTEAAVENGRRADAAFAAERQRLEAALLSVTESDREARQALAAADAARADLERRQTSLLNAVSRLADEARRIEGSDTAVVDVMQTAGQEPDDVGREEGGD